VTSAAGPRVRPPEGYVLASYGPERYLRHAVASATSIRRHDRQRPIALYCTSEHERLLRDAGLESLFEVIHELPQAHRSIVGFKHHLHRFMPFQRNLFADSDIVWCRDPTGLWERLRDFGFTATGIAEADIFFGAAKGPAVIGDVLLRRRARTLKRFGLSNLPRIQSGLMFAQDEDMTRQVCEAAQRFLARRDETHFRSRLSESGRTLESCEWSLAMAMQARDVPILPWRDGPDSPQVDYFRAATEHDADFTRVRYRYFHDRFVHELQSIRNPRIRTGMLRIAALAGRGDHLTMTPIALHFGWLHEKEPFETFARRTWEAVTPSG